MTTQNVLCPFGKREKLLGGRRPTGLGGQRHSRAAVTKSTVPVPRPICEGIQATGGGAAIDASVSW